MLSYLAFPTQCLGQVATPCGAHLCTGTALGTTGRQKKLHPEVSVRSKINLRQQGLWHGPCSWRAEICVDRAIKEASLVMGLRDK